MGELADIRSENPFSRPPTPRAKDIVALGPYALRRRNLSFPVAATLAAFFFGRPAFSDSAPPGLVHPSRRFCALLRFQSPATLKETPTAAHLFYAPPILPGGSFATVQSSPDSLPLACFSRDLLPSFLCSSTKSPSGLRGCLLDTIQSSPF